MSRFNKVLSQLECIHQIAKPVTEQADPLLISDTIHHIFENKSAYGLNGNDLTVEWFAQFSERNPKHAMKFIDNILQENGHIVSKKCIIEAIDLYNKEFENV